MPLRDVRYTYTTYGELVVLLVRYLDRIPRFLALRVGSFYIMPSPGIEFSHGLRGLRRVGNLFSGLCWPSSLS